MKEASEETGLQSLKLLSHSIFDIDIHAIPARKDFPEHLHYDVRMLCTASISERFIVSSESHDLAWVKLEELSAKTDNNTSMIRMAEKTKRLFRGDQE
jgi:8-oxo-dGTP pyrophosphatase MutT (NUDIX family)